MSHTLFLDKFVEVNDYDRDEVKKVIESYDPEREKRERSNNILWVPFVPGAEGLQKKLRDKFDVETAFKRGNTIGRQLSHLKRKKTGLEYSGVVYEINCEVCKMPYIGETGQQLGERVSEHKGSCRRAELTNGIFEHMSKSDHRISCDWF